MSLAERSDLPSARVCVVVKAWPRVSTTFIAQELIGLEREGLQLWLASMRPAEKGFRTLHDQLRAPVHYLPDPLRGPLRLLRAWAQVRRRPAYASALTMFRADMARSPSRQRLVAFTQAIALAAEMPDDAGLIYAQFIHSVGTLSRYAATMTGLPFVASAHAKDIWTTSERDKRDKLAAMRWCTTCTASGAEHLRAVADDPDKVKLVYHGLDFSRFPDPPPRVHRDGGDPADPIRLLSVGRAVEKKGFDVMLSALAGLPTRLAWTWHHVGAGPMLSDLRQRARELQIDKKITWHGVQAQEKVVELYRDCDLFVLPSRAADDGDRDGLPNVLMEAQSQALACLSTNFSGIPELIVDGVTGMLVPPGNADRLVEAMTQMIEAPVLRQAIGAAGSTRARSSFDARSGIAKVARLLRRELASAAGQTIS